MKIFGIQIISPFKSLRAQLVISHLVPLLIASPLMVLMVSFALKTDYLMADVIHTVIAQARLINENAGKDVSVWDNLESAEMSLRMVRSEVRSQILLIDEAGSLARLDNHYQDGQLTGVAPTTIYDIQEETLWRMPIRDVLEVPYEDQMDVLIPVMARDMSLTGLVRVSFPGEYFDHALHTNMVRVVISLIGILVVGLLVGNYQSRFLSSQLVEASQAINDLAEGRRDQQLPEIGASEIKALAASFNELESRLELSETKRKRLMSYLTHELGRPLGALGSAVDALQRGAWNDPELREILTKGMKSEIKQLEVLVGQLRLIREENEPVVGYVMVESDLVALLQQAATYWKEYAALQGITLDLDIQGELPPRGIDNYSFNQALGNLISNAIKYNHNGGKVTLKAWSEPTETTIQVIDTGTGISEEDLPRLFDMYYRGTNRAIVQGMGLGLSIVKDVIRAHNGIVTVKSKPGVGSVFSIVLDNEE